MNDSDSTKIDGLPMIVHLCGDEEFIEEFCLTADDAMTKLGIKRSRLTQISGRELRVGKIRDNRYVRPVYREEDIQRYLNWSRPTATHKASSLAFAEVSNSLIEHIESSIKDLKGLINTEKEANNLAEKRLIKSQELRFIQLKAQMNEQDIKLRGILNNLENRLIKHRKTQNKTLQESLNNTKAHLTAIDRVETQLALQSQQFEQVKIHLKKIENKLVRNEKMVSDMVDKITEFMEPKQTSLESQAPTHQIKTNFCKKGRLRLTQIF